MAFLDLTGELLSKVDFEKSKIIQPQKLVFVCGGMKSGYPSAPTSMREILLTKAEVTGNAGELGGVKVILAEAAVNYLAESSFSNLLDLERYIAAVVHAVILIVESPGSICELGAFVITPEIRKKLIVIMQSEQLHRSSFIYNGAIKYFKDREVNPQIFGYQWSVAKDTRIITVANFVVDQMLAQLPAAMDAVHAMHAKEVLKINLDGHLVFLTLAFCHLLRAAKQADVKQCFEFANIEITETRLKHFIDILVICQLIKPVRHGKLDFYVALVEQMPLKITFKEGTEKADRNTARWIKRIVEEIISDKDEKFRIEMFRGARDA